jgi:hypothetical protein
LPDEWQTGRASQFNEFDDLKVKENCLFGTGAYKGYYWLMKVSG